MSLFSLRPHVGLVVLATAWWASVFPSWNILSAADTFQDFSAVEVFAPPPPPPPLPYPLGQFGSVPGASVLTGGWSGDFLRLTRQVASQHNTIGFDQAHTGPYDLLIAEFDFRIDNGPGGADGFGFAYLNSTDYGTTGVMPLPISGLPAEEPGYANSLGIGFDTFHNGVSGLDTSVPGVDASVPDTVSMHFNGVKLAEANLATTAIPSIENGVPTHALVAIAPDPAGATVFLQLTQGATTISPFGDAGVLVPGMTTAYDGRVGFAGRTGGAFANTDIDNVRLTVTPTGGAETVIPIADFEAFGADPQMPPQATTGTPFTISGSTRFVPDTVGVMARTAQLAQELGGQDGRIGFNQTSGHAPQIIAEFDFQIADRGALGRADGMSMVLMDPATNGPSGTVPGYDGPAEEPNLANALGVAFDTFADGASTRPLDLDQLPRTANHVSLHWNNRRLAQVDLDPAQIDLVNPGVHHAVVEVTETAGGGLVTLSIVDAADGSVHTPFDNVFVPGLAFPNGARIGFAARTGGAADEFNIDNVSVAFIPEPSTYALAIVTALAGLGVARRRRRRAAA